MDTLPSTRSDVKPESRQVRRAKERSAEKAFQARHRQMSRALRQDLEEAGRRAEEREVQRNLEAQVEGTLFNIIQEAVNNALKHAQANHIWVRLRREGINLLTVVQDDGVGFDLQKVLASYEQRGSFGLLNIDERARLVGGNAELESTPGKGTRVTILVPLGG